MKPTQQRCLLKPLGLNLLSIVTIVTLSTVVFGAVKSYLGIGEKWWPSPYGANDQRGAASEGLTPTPDNWAVSPNIFVGETDDEAREFAREGSLGKCIDYILELTRRTASNGVGLWKPRPDMADEEVNLDYFMDEFIIAGSPETVTKQLIELRTKVGEFGNIVLVAHDFDNREKWLRSVELFATEVLPAVNESIQPSFN